MGSAVRILITGGAGFIGSNLCDYFIEHGHTVVCLDNLSTGFKHNIEHLMAHPSFHFIQGDICDLVTCRKAVDSCDYVLHHAALGSVPRSIEDPIATNLSNINGFLNMLVASRDAGVHRFVYAASSSTYGDSKKLPKIESEIGRPLSPYAITKYVNELYADVFVKTYGMQCIGLRYFNVFGRQQDPYGAYAAVIPLWVKSLLAHESPYINGDGSFSRDFTYIDNVIQANEKAMFTDNEAIFRGREMYYNVDKLRGEQLLLGKESFSEVFNVAFGGNTSLNVLFKTLRDNLALHDPQIAEVAVEYRAERVGDIPHSQASIFKAKTILNYHPQYSAEQGFARACEWYFNHMQK